MQPKSKRRVHGAEFKTQVLAECQQLGASVAAIALAHAWPEREPAAQVA
jgi:transposase